jgi:hypothetical protein
MSNSPIFLPYKEQVEIVLNSLQLMHPSDCKGDVKEAISSAICMPSCLGRHFLIGRAFNDHLALSRSTHVSSNSYFICYSDKALVRKEKIELFANKIQGKVILEVREIPSSLLFAITMNESTKALFHDYIDDPKTIHASIDHDSYYLHYFAGDVLRAVCEEADNNNYKKSTLTNIIKALTEKVFSEYGNKAIDDVLVIRYLCDAIRLFPLVAPEVIIKLTKSDTLSEYVIREIMSYMADYHATRSKDVFNSYIHFLSILTPHKVVNAMGGMTKNDKHYLESKEKNWSLLSPARAMSQKPFNISEKACMGIGDDKKRISENLLALKKLQDQGHFITPEIVTVSSFYVRDNFQNVLTNIQGINDIDDKIQDWMALSASQSSTFKLDSALNNTLENPSYKSSRSSTSEILEKVDYLLNHFNKNGDYIPSSFTLGRAIATNESAIVRKILSLLPNDYTYTISYLEEALDGLEPTTSEGVIEDVKYLAKIYFDMLFKQKNISSDVDKFKLLYKSKKSLSVIAMRVAKDLSLDDISSEIKGSKQLTFFLNTSGISPFEMLSLTESPTIKKLCMDLIAQ